MEWSPRHGTNVSGGEWFGVGLVRCWQSNLQDRVERPCRIDLVCNKGTQRGRTATKGPARPAGRQRQRGPPGRTAPTTAACRPRSGAIRLAARVGDAGVQVKPMRARGADAAGYMRAPHPPCLSGSTPPGWPGPRRPPPPASLSPVWG